MCVFPSPMLIWALQRSQCFKIRVTQHWGGRGHITETTKVWGVNLKNFLENSREAVSVSTIFDQGCSSLVRSLATPNGEVGKVAPRPKHFLVFVRIRISMSQFMLGIPRQNASYLHTKQHPLWLHGSFSPISTNPSQLTKLLHSHMPDKLKNPHTCVIQRRPSVRSHSVLFRLYIAVNAFCFLVH